MATTTEHAAEIRAQLKRSHGWNSRQVSVRASYFSLGSSIEVEVKDPSIPLPVVKAIAEQAERIHRCEVTGEILGGGNRYVSVRYSTAALATIAGRYAEAVERAVAGVLPGSNSLRGVEGTPFFVGRPQAGRVTLWEDQYISDGGSVAHIAATIGSLLVARQAVAS